MAATMTIGPEAVGALEDSELLRSWLAEDGHDANHVARVWVLEDGLVELDVYRLNLAGQPFRDTRTGRPAIDRVSYRPSSPPPAALRWTVASTPGGQ